MKILIISQYFWPEVCPLNHLAVGLKNKGHEVVVLTGMPNYPGGSFFPGYSFLSPRKETYSGVKVIRVPTVPRGKNNRLFLMINYLSFAFFASLLSPLYCKGRYDLIFNYQTSPITASLPAVLLKRIKKIPMFLWVQDLWPDSLEALGVVKNRVFLKFIEKFVRLVYKNSDTILVQSKGFVSSIKKILGDVDKDIYYLPNWADDIYCPRNMVDAQKKLDDIPKGFVMLYGGNVGKAQGFDVILKVMLKLKSYSELHLVIVGDGSELDWLTKQVALYDLSRCVHLLGRKDQKLMPFYFAASDILMVSLKKSPLFGITIASKLQAYLASGKPILAVLEGIGADIVREAKAGFVVTPGDAEQFIDVVERILKIERKDLEKMGVNGRHYYETNFDYILLLNKLENWFLEKCYR